MIWEGGGGGGWVGWVGCRFGVIYTATRWRFVSLYGNYDGDGSAENVGDAAPNGGELEDVETNGDVRIANGGRRVGGRCREKRRKEGKEG